MINSFDIFAEFYNRVKESESMADIIKEYEEGIELGKPRPVVIREIAAKHNLSYNSVCAITKELREPSLFEKEMI